MINETTNGKTLNIEKIYQEWFTIANISENIATGAENWGRLRLEELLKEGLLYVSYIGHAGSIVFTHDNRLWSIPDVQSVKYPYLPFFSIAACETASYDLDCRSISEELMLTPNGGAIGVLSAARTVYSSQNDKLNRALASQIFSANTDGSYRTIGEACMAAKKSFGQTYNYNKLSFTLFGDPAVKIRFPLNRCKVNTINEKSVAEGVVTVSPSTKVTISGVVNDSNGNIDTSFNGEITISVFDKEIAYKDLTSPNTKVVYNSKYPREKLCHSKGKVENGVYSVDVVLPDNCLAAGDEGLIRMFAKSEDNRLVSGCESGIVISAYDESVAIKDENAPVITQLTINGQTAESVIYSSENPTVNFMVTDDVVINTKPNDIAGSMKLIVDDGKISVSSLSNYTEATNGGKMLVGSVPLHNLQVGQHTLKLEVSDVAGNTTTKQIEFYVVDGYQNCVFTMNEDVVRDKVEFAWECENELLGSTIIVQDNHNNSLLEKEVSGQSFIWDLCDDEGNRVNPGKYKAYVKYRTEIGYGVTSAQAVIVLRN